MREEAIIIKRFVDRIILLILDSAGVGEMPDAQDYGDKGASTVPHIAEAVGGLNLPHMEKIGLGAIVPIKGVKDNPKIGAYGKMAEVSKGKDTTTGHWEIAGLINENPFPTYPEGFPEEVIKAFSEKIGRDILGNYPESGTVIIEKLGEEHIKTKKPIVYTSADSVFQIAAHEEVISVEELYEYCRAARKILGGKHAVGRVIARPFVGEPGNFKRTERRQDFSLHPPEDTILDNLKSDGFEVMGVGKIEDIFANQGLTQSNHVIDNMETVDATLDFMDSGKKGLIFANLVEFDMKYGHRNDPEGYAGALEEFDKRIPEIKEKMTDNDLLIMTADHGCDPTYHTTDHTREYVPLLSYHKRMKSSINLGIRSSFSDIAATIADLFNVKGTGNGKSFAHELSFK